MKELLLFVVRELVDQPGAVRVRQREGRFTVTLELTVAPGDAGKVIGRGGRVAKALRDVLGVAAARERKRVHLDIKS
ncbi:KH domain-containing protein [Kallotenue papyrolyticum]|uniref:KH domain-containing protein n=1 Tax=Kallotenue papyrolyticum TaxID=1325125 RepID=UPI0004928585|nr:KH domain-containing protein [Kallotenue papyrolyticum]